MAEVTTIVKDVAESKTVKALVMHELPNLLLILVGTALSSFGYVLFQVPHKVSAGGITGLALIFDHYVGVNLGLTFWLLSVPMVAMGFFYLGGWKFLIKVGFGATTFAIFIEVFTQVMPQVLPAWPLSADVLLSTVYGGVLGGIGGGLVYRAGGTMPGTGVVARIIQLRTSLPLSQVYMFFDGAILLAAGLTFGWEVVLYGFLMLFINGLASDYVLEGASTTRTVTVITDQPEAISKAFRSELRRNSSYWEVRGGWSGHQHYMVVSTIGRPQMQAVRRIVARTDANAFVTIGSSTTAYGTGFVRLHRQADDVDELTIG